MSSPPVSKAKAWVALAGSLLTVIVPLLLSVSTSLPEPWPALIGAVVAALTALGVYRAPYLPADTVVAPRPVTGDEYPNPWE